ncbi:MAG: hypothetical protein QI197_05515 [Candidatus Korarchaeota archaeon]|nr:hypothetical protein [Candidatus Korarchaeota archaeon]
MSVVDQIPYIRVKFYNPLSGKVYPELGEEWGVLDTGYEGFALVPSEVLHKLGIRPSTERHLVLPDGRVIKSMGGYSTLISGDYKVDGLLESYEGLNEIIIGGEALERARVEIDYCIKSVTVIKC